MRLHHLYPSPNLWLCPGPLQLCLVLLCLLQRSVQPDLQCVVTACCLLLSSLHTTHLLRCSRGGRGGGEGERREERGGEWEEGERGRKGEGSTHLHVNTKNWMITPSLCAVQPSPPPSFLPSSVPQAEPPAPHTCSSDCLLPACTCLFVSGVVCVFVCVCLCVCVCVCVCEWER